MRLRVESFHKFCVTSVIVIFMTMFVQGEAMVSGECRTGTEPWIEITYLPPYGSTQNLCGVVSNVNPAEYHIATYVFLEGMGWYTKPTWAAPCTLIDPDGSWCVDVTTGGCDPFASKYAVYLLAVEEPCPLADAAAVPPPHSTEAPRDIKDRNPFLDEASEFPDASGYFWVEKDADYRLGQLSCKVGPGFDPGVGNYFSPDNVWIDESGMHLAINDNEGPWECAEIYLRDSLGYGEYRIHTTGRIDTIDPQMVFGMFTWDNWEPPNFREMDIELAQWGDPTDICNSEYVVQPCSSCLGCGLKCNEMCWRFEVQCLDDSCPITWIMNWMPGEVNFSVFEGHHLCTPPEPPLEEWTKTSGVPTPGIETFRLNFWLFEGSPPQYGQGEEITVNYFHHAPPLGDIGSSLIVDKSEQNPGNLVLSWESACGTGLVTDYAVYEGSLDSLRGTGQYVEPCYDHAPKECSAGLDHQEEIIPSDASGLYYLVVPQGPTGEGGYGFAVNQLAPLPKQKGPRPASSSPCLEPQSSAPCVPRDCPNLLEADEEH